MEGIRTISIIGLGLIGGSLAMALKKAGIGEKIIGIGRQESRLQEAMRLGIVDKMTTDLFFGVKNADLVVLATPISAILSLANDMLPYLRRGTIVTDVGSTKAEIVQRLTLFLADVGVHFVGSHPMAGSDESGLAAAKEDLFKNAVCVLTPIEETSQEALSRVKSIWLEIGCQVAELNPELHDRLVSASSHLPHLAASCLIDLASQYDQKITYLIASGFRDTTRIAGGHPVIWKDIFLTNKTYLLEAISKFKMSLEKWQELIQRDNQNGLIHELENINLLKQRLRG